MADGTSSLPAEIVIDHLQNLVLGTEDVKEMLDELADFTARALSDSAVAFSSITLMRQKKPLTVAYSEQGALTLDEVQYRGGDGPCLAAIREQAVIHVPDLGRERRWPDYTAAARREGVGSCLSVPLNLQGEAEAGLNIYSTRTYGFKGDDIERAQSYAQEASKALRLAVQVSQLTEAKAHLTAALESRTVIDLAAGAIMGQNRCSQESAMRILKIASNTRNVKLRDVAASVIASLTGGTEVHTHFDV
ncbi:GAF and ANTAR domain-containing protein [Pseudarthrobacter sp902506025]|uniref:GAF and ANTAR domain-containing protein n=1 Tax=Pseudarthrobacter sp. 902506025 TaxID=3155291 RepID=UPI00344B6C72